MPSNGRMTACAILLLSCAVLVGRAASTRAPSPAQGRGQAGGRALERLGERLLFVWDGTIPGDPARTAALLDFAAARDVDVLALDATGVGYGLPGALAGYTSFVQDAHAAGLEVLALGGSPWFAVACGAVPGQPTCHDEGWSYYETIAQSGVPFDGILDDSEPASGPAAWWSNHAQSGQQYLDYLHGVDARIGSLPFHHAIPFWYDEDPSLNLVLDGETQPHPLNWYVQKIVDEVVLMDYRDQAGGPDGIVAHAQGELALGPCVIGVETQDLGPAGDKLTFWEEGQAHMEGQLGKVLAAYGAQPTFRGFSIHHYASYLQLAP